MPDRDHAAQLERWLTRRGIPHFIHRYSASQDVLTRAIPVLTLIFLFEVIGATNLDWPWWANLLSAIAGLGILVGAWMALNRWRGRRLLARPDRVGWVEGSLFVLVPALLPLLFGGELDEAGFVIVANLVILAVIYLMTSYGIVPMTRWATVRLFVEIGETLRLFTRGLPLLLVAFTFLFINAEVWQMAGTLEHAYLAAVLGLFVLLGVVFIVARLPGELRRAAVFDAAAAIATETAGTPAFGLTVPEPAAVPEPSRREWSNAGLVVLFTQGMRVLLASLLIGGFFILFGLLTMRAETMVSWTQAPPEILASFTLFGRETIVTAELLRVAVFLAGFSGLYFAVYLVTDATFRSEFFEDAITEMRQAFAVRAVYLATHLRNDTAQDDLARDE
jgi:hypothetical protein